MADQNKGKYPLKPMVERRAWIFWTNYERKGEAKPKQSQITVGTPLKAMLYHYSI